MRGVLLAATIAAAVGIGSTTVNAQERRITGAAIGGGVGAVVAGPPGAIVGGAIGAYVGGPKLPRTHCWRHNGHRHCR